MTNPIDSRQLNTFATIVKAGSFTQAARELALTQSAVSHAVRSLEDQIGCRLFDKVGKKRALTMAGEQLYQHAEKVMTELCAARKSMDALGKWGKNRLRIGASSTACQYILPSVLREFKECFPDSMISIHPGDVEHSINRLEDNTIDVAISLLPTRRNGFDHAPLFSDELHFLMSPLHPWAQLPSIPRESISAQNYVLYSRSSYTFMIVEDYFNRLNMPLNTVIELGNMEAIKELVKIGLGLSILAPWIVRDELRQGSLVSRPLGRKKLRRNWAVLYRKSKKLSLHEETFIGLCRGLTENGFAT